MSSLSHTHTHSKLAYTLNIVSNVFLCIYYCAVVISRASAMGLMHHVIMWPAVTMTTVLVSPRGGRGRLPIVILLLLHLGPVGTRDGLITLTQPLLLLLPLTGSSLSLRHFVLRVLGRLFQLRQSLICLEDKRDHHTYVRHRLHIQCVCVCVW